MSAFDLARASADDFTPHVATTFLLEAGDYIRFPLRLDGVERLRGAPGRREPFSLFFEGPPEARLPQRIYRLEHDTMGQMEIFLVPIAASADSVCFQAVFN